jgi:hypothetical protein
MKTALTRSVLAILLLAMVSLVNNASAHASSPWDTPQFASSPGTSGGVNAPAAQIPCNWTGTWDTDRGKTTITQTGNRFSGTRWSEGFNAAIPISGTVSANRLNGLHAYSGITNPDFMFLQADIAEDCNSFAGGLVEGVMYYRWYGTRSGAPAPIPQPNTNATNMTIQVAQRKVFTGDLVLVPVWIIKADNVANINYQITYDAQVAKPEGSLSKGDLLDNALFSVNANQSGSVLSGFAQTTGLAGTGTVLNIPFRAVGKPGDRTPLDVTVTTINDPNGGVLKIDRIPGEILIYNKDGTFPQPPSTTGGAPSAPPPPAIPRGDCDGDGKVTEVDALCALEISVNLRPSKPLMDIDNSGDVTSRDAVIILQIAINKEVEVQ